MAFFFLVIPSRIVGIKSRLSIAAIEKKSKEAPMCGVLGLDEDSITERIQSNRKKTKKESSPVTAALLSVVNSARSRPRQQLVGVIPRS